MRHVWKIRYKTGKEWLAKRNSMPINNPLLSYDCKNDICEPELLDKYRALTGEYPEAINRAEKMIYANYRYILYDKLMEHNDVPKRIYIINQILTKYPPRSVAMRIGGIHSTMLYYILNDENREKIWGIIDIDPECACSNLNLPVISPDKVSESKEIKAVILSSYANLQILREEAKNWEPFIDILDIYDSFREHGLVCEGNFWGLKGNEEDYDVGFPFKE